MSGMVPYPDAFFHDPIALFRHDPETSAQGGPRRRFNTAAVALMASVQMGQPARTDARGRTYESTPTVIYTRDDPEAKPDDRIVWIDPTGVSRTFTVDSRSVPRGIPGAVHPAWSTRCEESK